MDKKIKDARKTLKIAMKEERKETKRIEESFGRKSWKTKSILREARIYGEKQEKDHKEKHTKKLETKVKKKETEECDNKIEDIIEELKETTKYIKEIDDNFEEKNEDPIMIIGVELNEDEIEALRIPPKTCLYDDLTKEDFIVDLEIMNTKLRFDGKDKSAEEDEELKNCPEEDLKDVEELQEKVTVEEAKTRQVFDPVSKTIDISRQKVTDLKLNRKCNLPKALEVAVESEMKIRTDMFLKAFEDHRKANCTDDKQIKQKQALKKNVLKGIKKLKARIKNKEVIICKTDKPRSLPKGWSGTYQ